MNFDESHWLAYRAVNLTFAQVVLSQVQKGDMVWVQDYHLMLLPMLLRGLIAGQSAGPEGTIGGDGVGSETQKELGRVVEGIETGAGEDQGEMPKSDRKPDAGPLGVNDIKIGFFLHTPFPSSEIYR
jgi:trehalose 6-phosphate synthase